MKDTIRVLLDDYLRKTLVSFTESDVSKYLLKKKHPCSADKILEFLRNSPNVYVDVDGNFCSRAGLFTSKYFSFVPTKAEIENGYLILGHRGMPFVDPEFLPNELHVFFCGDLIQKKVIEVNTADILPLYSFYGEEYIPQIIAQDTANPLLDLSQTDYMLPSKVNLTVLDFEEFYKESNFKLGDRIIALVSDWDKGFINVAPFCKRGKTPFEQSSVDNKRERWEEEFEKLLSATLEAFGPCASIEEQLVFAFITDIERFCVPYCSSVQEVIEKSKKFEFTSYGVETRLWLKGKEIPALGAEMIDFSPVDEKSKSGLKKDSKVNSIFKKYGLIVPEWIIDGFIYDFLFSKSENLGSIIEKIVPDLIALEKTEYNAILLHLEKKFAIIRKSYNWFADYQVSHYRNEALKLYSKLVSVFYEIEYHKIEISELDQQHLVILTQLSGHISSMIYSFLQDDGLIEKDLSTLEATLEGMNFNFEESAKVIRDNIYAHQKRTLNLSSYMDDKK